MRVPITPAMAGKPQRSHTWGTPRTRVRAWRKQASHPGRACSTPGRILNPKTTPRTPAGLQGQAGGSHVSGPGLNLAPLCMFVHTQVYKAKQAGIVAFKLYPAGGRWALHCFLHAGSSGKPAAAYQAPLYPADGRWALHCCLHAKLHRKTNSSKPSCTQQMGVMSLHLTAGDVAPRHVR